MKPEYFVRTIVLITFLFIIDLYAYQAVKTIVSKSVHKNTAHYAYWLVSLLLMVWLVYSMATFKKNAGIQQFTLISAVIFAVYIAKLFMAFVLLGEDGFRVLEGIGKKIIGANTNGFLHERRKFIAQLATGVGAIMLGAVAYGVTKGKYNYKIVRRSISFADLPDAFDGFTITQISDIHSGSFDNKAAVEHGIDLVNDQKSDVILFTGDIVNNIATELEPWKNSFSRLKAPMGVFSILGNHDYGDYINWDSAVEKENNLQKLIAMHRSMGFDILLNEHRTLQKSGQQINLVGVENWGKPPFPQYGDLSKAFRGATKQAFNILMSHDPSHWRGEVLDFSQKIHLTLSGHTHGMQFGVEIPGWLKFSPVQWKYPEWADLYTEKERYLYVNRGFGFLGFPGRVGIMPEITVITLKKA